MSTVVVLDRKHRGVWRRRNGVRWWQPIDTPVIRPIDTSFFCDHCDCWLTHQDEPCPACAVNEDLIRRDAETAALHTLTLAHLDEYDQLVEAETKKRVTIT